MASLIPDGLPSVDISADGRNGGDVLGEPFVVLRDDSNGSPPSGANTPDPGGNAGSIYTDVGGPLSGSTDDC